MALDRRFRFGVQLSRADSGEQWLAWARRAEELGYDTLFLPDHLGDQLSPIPALTAAAMATSELRIGSLVFANDFKHPVVLAKEVATLDLLSQGRVELGLGAGWMTTDYEQSGIPLDPPGVRVDRLEEAIEVVKGVLGNESFDFDGIHYDITGLRSGPPPVQRPHPPLLIGGGGRRVLSLAGREADIVGINPNLRAGQVGPEVADEVRPDRIDEKVGWVRDAAGDRYRDLELNLLVFSATVTDDRRGTAEGFAAMFGASTEELLEVPYVWIGSVPEICETVQGFRDRWDLSYFVFQGEEAMEAMAPVVAELSGR